MIIVSNTCHHQIFLDIACIYEDIVSMKCKVYVYHIIRRFYGRYTQRFDSRIFPTNYPKAFCFASFKFFSNIFLIYF